MAWTAQGKKALGFLCSHVPEEILYAADILPYRLRAPGCRDTAAADVYMGHVNCTFVRSCLEQIYDAKFDFLDGFVFTNSCDHTRRLYDVLTGKDTAKPYDSLAAADRQAVLEILRETKKGLPDYWAAKSS